MAAFSASATLAGGLVTQWFSWRITVVLPVIAALALPVCVRLGRRGGSRARIDGPGAVLLAVTVSALLVVVQAETLTLSTAAVLTATALTVAGALALAWHLRRTVTGFVPLALVRDPLFVRAAAVGAGVYGGLFWMMWGTPQILVGQHHWSGLHGGRGSAAGRARGSGLLPRGRAADWGSAGSLDPPRVRRASRALHHLCVVARRQPARLDRGRVVCVRRVRCHAGRDHLPDVGAYPTRAPRQARSAS